MSSESNAQDAAAEEHEFVWGAAVDADSPSDDPDTTAPPASGAVTACDAGGFEWCEPVADSEPNSVSESTSNADSGSKLYLDPSLTTETRLDGTDDEAVALLAALRHDPTYGRWRRVETELDEESASDEDENEDG